MLVAGGAAAVLALPAAPQPGAWKTEFGVDKADFVAAGRNPYFVLEPGYTLTLEHGAERLVITVLADTKVVDGVETRVVEERETNKGQLVEVSRNYYAMSRKTNDVFYFGEDVDMYKNGRITSHEGSWMAGAKSAKAGLMMPAQPVLRMRYHQEVAPGLAMDRAEIVSLTATVTGGAGPWQNCVKTEETTPLEPLTREYKYYAPGIGLVQDGDVKLVKFGMATPAK